MLKPTEIEVVDSNTVQLDFDNGESGFVLIKEIDNEFLRFSATPTT